MKCPKCGYIGFEELDRCRNCGYDFSLNVPASEPDLSMRTGRDTPFSLDDLTLDDRVRTEPLLAEPTPDFAPTPPGRTPGELPLFARSVPDSTPVRARPTPPRPPVAVRRPTPEPPRLRVPQPRSAMLDLMSEEAEDDVRPSIAPREPIVFEPAGLVARGFALLVDVVLVAGIDALVIYLTLQICGLRPNELALLPKVPLVAFFVVQNGGYFAAFTAGGQTIGKMITGIRVVSDADLPIGVGPAIVRTVVWALLAAPLGLGLLTALFSADHRGLHDRCAGTKVVRETAA
jgi:uncharacterized RDD family membrane protein YckC